MNKVMCSNNESTVRQTVPAIFTEWECEKNSKKLLKVLMHVQSQYSLASRQSSGASTASFSAIKARAKAEAARAELLFAEEARIIKQ